MGLKTKKSEQVNPELNIGIRTSKVFPTTSHNTTDSVSRGIETPKKGGICDEPSGHRSH